MKEKSIEDISDIAREQGRAESQLTIQHLNQRFEMQKNMVNSVLSDLEKANQTIWELKQEIKRLQTK